MLKQQFRLKKNSAFQATYRVRNSYCISGVVLWVGKARVSRGRNDSQECEALETRLTRTSKTWIDSPTKVGFVVSTKTHKRAVKRNRLKRLMRESYRILLQNGEVGESQKYMSLIFVGMERALDKNFFEMKEIIKKLIYNIK